MASNSLTPYYDSTNQYTFALVSTSDNGAKYMVSGRDIAVPYVIEITRKLTAANATSNDHVQVRIARSERNASTGKIATAQILLDISIPKDTSIITQTEQQKMLSAICSLLRDNSANLATKVNITALVGGFDL